MTVCFRLLDGFTSFMWSLRSVHFFSSGPSGILEFRVMAFLAVDETREDGHGDGDVGKGDERRGHGGEPLQARRVARMGETERAEHRVDAMPEVEPQRYHRDDVRDGCRGIQEALRDVERRVEL